MEKDYLFKLNVQPHVLEKYSGSRIETLKNELLPHIISFSFGNDLFSQTDSNIQLEGDRMGFQIVRNYQDILESEEYERLIELTSELTKEYVGLVENILIKTEFIIVKNIWINIRKQLNYEKNY